MEVSLKNITTENTESTEKNVLEYYHLGEIQIDGAIDMYEQGNFICAITLAGSANLLMEGFPSNGVFSDAPNSQTMARKMLTEEYNIDETRIPDLSLPRNSLKHLNKFEKFCNDPYYKERDYKDLAETEIRFAAFNYVRHTRLEKKRMCAFIDTLNSKVNKNAKEPDINILSGEIIDCAIQVHKKLGPGLLESAYQHAMAYMMAQRNISFEKEKSIAISIDDLKIDAGYRADFIVNKNIIVEIKSVDKLAPIHDAQLLTYMKLGNFSLGIMLNFNEKLMKDGIKRMKL